MSIPFVSLSDTFDQWRSKTNANSVNVGDLVLLTTPVTSDIVSAINEVNQRLINVDQTALREVVEDPTPELGGNLSLNSNDIVGIGNIVIDGVISGTIAVGGDLTGTTANAQINPNSIGITELNLPDGTAGQFLKTDGIGGLSFDTVLTDASNEVVGGDVSGVVSNIQINPNVVGIDELDVSDGNAGQVLSTDGSGTLSFVDGGIGGSNSADYEEDILIGDGTTTTFIFPSNTSAPSAEAILVSIDGVIQPTSSYELPLPTSIRFPNTPPDSGATIRVLHLGVVSTASPGSTLFVEDLFDGNGGTDYTLTEDAPVRETILVYVDGVSQPTTEYSLPTLRTIRFVEAPLIGSSVRVVHLGVAQQGLATGSSNFVEDLFLGDGTTDFTLSQPAPTKETILVFVNGVSQPTTIYNLLSSTVIRFLEAPSVNSNVKVLHLGIAGTVADGSITTPKLADNAVTPAKLGAGVILAQTIAPNSVGIPELNVSDGNIGEFLQTNGNGVLEFAAVAASSGGGGGLESMQTFLPLPNNDNSEQTWSKPEGVKKIMYYVSGAGGGGAGGPSAGPPGAGGKAGGTAIGILDVSNISSFPVRVGHGGGINNNAVNGASSYIGDLVADTGAPGATNNQGSIATGQGGSGNSGGLALGGDFNLEGANGQSFGQPGQGFWHPFGRGGNGAAGSFGSAGGAGVVVIIEYGGPEETTSSGGGGAASGGAFQGTIEGYTVGGAIAAGGFVRSQLTIIEAYSFIVDGNTNNQIGNLSQGRMDSGGFASSTHGYSVGGRIGENSNNLNSIDYSAVVDKFSFATANTVTQPFTLAQRHGNLTTHTSATRGYYSGGHLQSGGAGTSGSQTDTLVIDSVLFASDNSRTSPGFIDVAVSQSNTTSSATDAYHISGRTRSPEAFVTVTYKFSFANEAPNTTIASLTGANTNRGHSNGGSYCDVTAGYVSSGNNAAGFNTTIEKYTYASDVVTVEPRTLVRDDNGVGSSSSTTHGYASGGTNPPGTTFASGQVTTSNQVQKFSFSSTNNSVDITTLSNATFNLSHHIQR